MSGGSFQTFQETLPCACDACNEICGGCLCPGGSPPSMVLRVDPGMSVQRVWGGTIESQATGNCGNIVTGPSCLQAQIPDVNEVLNLHLEYANSAPGVGLVDGGVPVPGGLPPGQNQTSDKQFRVEDGTVEVGPVPGAACMTNADCTNPGELCFNGGCTTGCPANTIPPVGGGWQVSIPDPINQGALSTSTAPNGDTVTSGAGVLTSVSYSNGTMNLGLTQPVDGGGTVFASVFITLPTGYAVPLSTQQALSVEILDASTAANPGDRAVILRDGSGNLLLAADSAQLGPVLAASDTAPFTVTGTQNLVGCDPDQCGKRLHFTTVFDGGPTPVELPGGQSQNVIVAGRTYQLLNVADDAYGQPETGCLQTLMPYAILYQPNP
jgi:hypothetical protein